jgi:Ca2+-transporting ATPase
MMACIVLGLPAPLLPIHLLWINLVTDGLPALCLATDSIEEDVMRRRPRPRSESILGRSFLQRLIVANIATAGVCFGIFSWAHAHGGLEAARSMTFTALVFCELFKSFSFRSDAKPVWRLGLRSNIALPVVVAGSFVLQLSLHHLEFLSRLMKTVTPEWPARWLLLTLGLAPLAALEAMKLFGAGKDALSDGQPARERSEPTSSNLPPA